MIDYLKGNNVRKEVKNMRVILISLPSPWLISDRVSNLLGVLYIASYLKQNSVDVEVVDLASIPEEYWYFPSGDIYGISCVSPQFIYAKKIARLLRNRQKDAMLVIGGIHPTSMPEETLRDTEFDIAVVGEGEETILEIALGYPISGIQGIYYKRDNTIIGNKSRPLKRNLDELPVPARDMIDTFSYRQIDVMGYLGKPKKSGELTMITSRGCPYNCTFCSQQLMTESKCRFVSAQKVIEEARELVFKYDVGRINFVDDMFTINKRRLTEICDGLKALGIEWQCLTRADDLDFDMYKKMAANGCVGVTFGIESGSQKILDIAQKCITVEQNKRGIETAKKAGLIVRSQLMIGLPGEDDQTIEETKHFIQTAPSDVWSIHIFVPFPGCNVWREPEKFNFYIDKNTDFSDYHTVGKPGEWKNIINPQAGKIAMYKDYLLGVAKGKNIFEYVDASKRVEI